MLVLRCALWLLLSVALSAPAAGVSLGRGDLLVSLGYSVVAVDPDAGTSQNVVDSGTDFFGQLAVAPDGRTYLAASRSGGDGIEVLDPATGSLTPVSSRFGALDIGAAGALYVLEGERVYHLGDGSSDDLVFDASTLPAFATRSISDFAIAADGDVLLLSSDDEVLRYTPGDLDASVLSMGGLFTSRAAEPGATWTSVQIDIGSDGTIYVGTWWYDDSLGGDRMRAVALDPTTLVQSEAQGGATLLFGGNHTSWVFGLDLEDRPLIGFDEPGSGARLGRLLDGSGESIAIPISPFIRGVAAYPVPEPSSGILVGLGLLALRGLRERSRPR